MDEPALVYEDATFRVATLKNLYVAAWFDPPTFEQAVRFGDTMRDLSRAYPGRAAMLDLIVNSTKIPTFGDDVRGHVIRLMRDAELVPAGVVHTVLLPGLKGAAVRTFLSATILVARPAPPTTVLGDLRAASAWLLPRLTSGGEAWTLFEIQSVAVKLARYY